MAVDEPFTPRVASRTSGEPFARPLARQAATWQRIEQVLRSARDQDGRISPRIEQARVTGDAITWAPYARVPAAWTAARAWTVAAAQGAQRYRSAGRGSPHEQHDPGENRIPGRARSSWMARVRGTWAAMTAVRQPTGSASNMARIASRWRARTARSAPDRASRGR